MIRCSNIQVEYTGRGGKRFAALDNVSLEIGNGEFVTVMGANGSGKSTLAACLAGLKRPHEGTVEIDGLDVSSERHAREIRGKTGIVFQSPDDQLLSNFIDREIALALENRGVPRDEMRRRVDAALETFGLTSLKDLQPLELSGGQKQKLALAAITVFEPRYLILDETTSYLDPAERRSILRRIKDEFESRRNDGFSVVLITQFAREALLGNRLVVLDRGRILADDRPETLFSEKAALLTDSGVPVPHEYYVGSLFPDIDVTGFQKEQYAAGNTGSNK